MQFPSEEIAWLYKRRWDIELFFKWIKQHCKIKNLIGHSGNAVKLQMITGIITYLLFRLTWEVVPQAYAPLPIGTDLVQIAVCTEFNIRLYKNNYFLLL